MDQYFVRQGSSGHPRPNPQRALAGTTEMSQLARKIVFVVEDDPDVNRLIRVNLQAAGYVAEPFSNVISALAKAQVQPPSLFLLDIMMPGEDGLGFCQRLREMPEFKKTPIIFVTAKSSEDDRVLGFECGADDYITKPFSPRELVARVNAALRKHCDEPVALRFGELEIIPEAMRLLVRGAGYRFLGR